MNTVSLLNSTPSQSTDCCVDPFYKWIEGKPVFILPKEQTFTPRQLDERVVICPRVITEKMKIISLAARNAMQDEELRRFVYYPAPEHIGIEAKEEQCEGFTVAYSSFIGSRDSMEDRSLITRFTVLIENKLTPVLLVAVFDGHGGDEAAEYAKANLTEYLKQKLTSFDLKGIQNALTSACVNLHYEFLKMGPYSGTTLVATIILNELIVTGNVGDSRAMISNGGKPDQLSVDSEARDPNHQRAPLRRGESFPDWDDGPRLGGILAMTRAIGDKGYGVVPRPEFTERTLSDQAPESFLILVSDGLTFAASTNQLVSAIHDNRNTPLSELAKNMIYSAHQHSDDNLSIILVKLTDKKEELKTTNSETPSVESSLSHMTMNPI